MSAIIASVGIVDWYGKVSVGNMIPVKYKAMLEIKLISSILLSTLEVNRNLLWFIINRDEPVQFYTCGNPY